MKVETISDTLAKLVGIGGDGAVLDAVIICLLTAIVKRLVLDKVKIDLLKSIDPTPIIPYICATLLVLIRVCIKGNWALYDVVYAVLTRGAISCCIYKAYSSTFGKGAKQLCKDPLFEVIYNTVLNFGDAREKLLGKSMTQESFLSQIGLLCDRVREIFRKTHSQQERQDAIRTLLGGVTEENSTEQVMPALYQALHTLLDKEA